MDLDLDMLTRDFVVVGTGSGTGSFYLEKESATYKSGDSTDLMGCKCAHDVIQVDVLEGERGIPVEFAHCRPSKSWIGALEKSGGLCGLAIGEGLAQMGVNGGKGLLEQLVEKAVISERIWSLMLVNGMEGVWSIGGTAAKGVREVEDAIKAELDKLEPGEDHTHVGLKREQKVAKRSDSIMRTSEEKDWEWSKVQGADGWWQILMKSLYISGRKVLSNQPVILDVRLPHFLFALLTKRKT